MDIIGKKNLYFLISLFVLIPGVVSLLLFGLRLSIDFTGGSRIEVQSEKFKVQPFDSAQGKNAKSDLEHALKEQGVGVSSIQRSGNDVYIIRTKPLDEKGHGKVFAALKKRFTDVRELSFQTVGPTIGKETTKNAFLAILAASVLIVLYIAWSFRHVPKPTSSFRFGICAIVALLHDVFVVVGIFSLLGHFLAIEVDSLFVTALLTIIGFSVHDTIVVFDRIRENLKKLIGAPFAQVVNDSILQTLVRSLNTSLTVLLVLFTLILFGGESIRWFIVALLVGITSGTYSSIFNAAPLLVVWEEWGRRTKRV